MKKTSKIFGTIALTAALAMGTAVPAFATAPSAEEATGDREIADATVDGNANTSIDVATYVSQISVALPLNMPVYANVGGGAGISPENYYIENLSRTDIQVEKVEWAIFDDAQNDWTLAADVIASDLEGAAAVNNTTTSAAPTYGSVSFTLTPRAEGYEYDNGLTGKNQVKWTSAGTGTQVDVMATASRTSVTDSLKGSDEDVDWLIPGASDTVMGSGTHLGLAVGTFSSALSKNLDDTYSNVVKVSYTVGAQTASPTA